MPTLRTPDGRKLRVPDDATPEQIQAVLESVGAAPGAAPAPAPAPAGPGGGPGAPGPAATPPPAIGAATPTPPAAPGPPVAAPMPESYDPTEGMSGMEKFLAGAGQSAVSTGRGVRQLWNMATNDQEELARLQAEEEEARRLDAPLLSTGAGRGGQVAGHIAQALLPVGAGAKVASTAGKFGLNAGLGAGMAGLQPTVEGESRGKNMAIGGAVGGLLPMGSRIVSLASDAKGAALRAIGRAVSEGPKVEAVRRAAGTQIGKLTEGVRVPLAPIKREVEAIKRDYGEALPRHVNKYLDQLSDYGAKGAKLTGERIQEARSALLREKGDLSGAARSGIDRLQRALDNATDDAMKGMPKTLRDTLLGSRAKRLRAAREQYRTGTKPEVLKPYTRAASRGAVEALRRPRPQEK